MKILITVLAILALTQNYDIVCSVGRPYQLTLDYKINDKEELVNTIYPDVNMVIDSRDGYIAQVIKRTGTWSPESIFTFGRLVNEGDTLLNVVSHIGIETIVFAKKAGGNAKIYFFEPYIITRNILIKNIYVNDLQDRATVYPYAASNKKMKAYLMVNIKNTGGSVVETEESLKKFKGPKDEKR